MPVIHRHNIFPGLPDSFRTSDLKKEKKSDRDGKGRAPSLEITTKS